MCEIENGASKGERVNEIFARREREPMREKAIESERERLSS